MILLESILYARIVMLYTQEGTLEIAQLKWMLEKVPRNVLDAQMKSTDLPLILSS